MQDAGYKQAQLDVEAGGGSGNSVKMRAFRYFEFRKQRYIFQEGANTFVRINSKLHIPFESIHPLRHGLSEKEAEFLTAQNGPNRIDIESISTSKMLLDKLLHPFYVFQALSVLIWTYESYFVYSYVIALTSIASIVWEIHLAKKNERGLRELSSSEEREVVVLRNNGVGTVSAPTRIQVQHLVVGDAVLIEEGGTTAAADLVLVQGDCVVDESSLTGESVPVVKTSLGYFDHRGEQFSVNKCKRSAVFCGSKIVQIKPLRYALPEKHEDSNTERVVGIVVATGFNSSKGQLFRGILYPNKIDIRFYRDAMLFIGTLGLIAICAFANRLVHGLKQGFSTFWVVVTSMDIITIAVPPALPLVLTVGVAQAVRRLKKASIFCISPERINYAGRIDIFCWDKTGTLTTSNLFWSGVEKSRESTFTGFRGSLRKDGDGDMERAVAACHSLNQVNGELIGSSVDVELFKATRFEFDQEEPTVMWKGHIFPVIARVSRPIAKAANTPATTTPSANVPTPAVSLFQNAISPTTPKLPPAVATDSNSLRLRIPTPQLLSNICESPGAVPSPPPNSPSSPETLLILRRFDFDVSLQRSSVIFKPHLSLSNRTPQSASPGKPVLPWEALTVVSKGSPETIRNICKQSTIPSDYHATYTRYTTAGWYVLAVAMRTLESEKPPEKSPSAPPMEKPAPQSATADSNKLKKSMSLKKMAAGFHQFPSETFRLSLGVSGSEGSVGKAKVSGVVVSSAEDLAAITRDQVERDMKFLGFVLLKNPLKGESGATVQMLTEAGVKSVIITGDNVMTGISAARQLNLCQQVLLIDVFDGVVGFRRLKQSILDPEANPLHNVVTEIPHASSIDSLTQPTPRLGNNKSHLHHTSMLHSASELTTSDEDSVAPLSRKNTTNEKVPKIRIRSATVDSNPNKVPEQAKDSFKVFPLDEIGRTQKQMKHGTEIAVTGAALEMLIATQSGWKENLVGEKFLDWLVLKGCVFARMKPDQKTWIVERLMKLGKYVGMCGDGANDTGALKAAHVGIALSDAEASIVAPFTSGRRRVSDVVKLLREGRCALDMNFMAFKFMFMYPLVQLATVSTLNQANSGLSNNQYLFDDLFVVLSLAFLMLRSSAARKLAPHGPTDNLLSAPIIYSILGQTAICAAFFAMNYYSLTSEDDWFCSVDTAKSMLNSSWLPINASAPYNVSYPCYYINPETDIIERLLIKSEENTVVWLFAHYQYAILSLSFIFTSPHRKPLYTNPLYLLTFLTVVGVMVLMNLSWEQWQGFNVMQSVFSIREGVQWGQRLESLYLAATNLAVSLLFETIIIDRFVRRWVEARESLDRRKLEDRVGKHAGIYSLNETIEDGEKAKRSALQKFGIITGILGGNSSQNGNESGGVNTAWEGYVQSVISATGRKKLDARLDIAAEMKNSRSWGDMGQNEEAKRIMSTGESNNEAAERMAEIGDRFEVEEGKSDGFDKGFDAWREGRRKTLL
ncbi:hypothetical protein HDU98_003819 [Podochytrium sp. JEL0797]|nr:hypothetical protein HDU98_003819 [Podochytrium sp. JEL0797]